MNESPVAWLSGYLTEQLGSPVSEGQARTALAKLNKEGLIAREGRTWTFDGAEDPTVVTVLDYFRTKPKRGAMPPVEEPVFTDLEILLEYP